MSEAREIRLRLLELVAPADMSKQKPPNRS
jgi:hypothetical protein